MSENASKTYHVLVWREHEIRLKKTLGAYARMQFIAYRTPIIAPSTPVLGRLRSGATNDVYVLYNEDRSVQWNEAQLQEVARQVEASIEKGRLVNTGSVYRW